MGDGWSPHPLTFTTRDIPEPSRHRALGALVDQGLMPVEPLPDKLPEVDFVKWRLPGAAILSGRFGGVRQTAAGAPPSDLFFGINLTGDSLARQHGQRLAIGSGEALVADPHGGAFTVLRPAPTRLIGLRVPRGSVPVDLTMRLVPAHTAALRLLIRYLRAVLDGPVPASAPLAGALARHVAELITLSLGPGGPDAWAERDLTVRAARLRAVQADIERHLTDSSLCVAAVAARQGITGRYVHKLFADGPVTYSQFVLERRLDLAYRQLRDPRRAARTVSAIAHGAGFGDLSYFNRAFRLRYGLTPSQVRRAAP